MSLTQDHITQAINSPTTDTDQKTLLILLSNPSIPPSQEDTMPTYNVNLEDLVELTPDTLIIPPEYTAFLKPYAIYTTKQQISDNKIYPFILIHIQDTDQYIRYDIYRYIAQLPWFVKVDDEHRLPTVDHISRNSQDNTLTNMRYCTMMQNAQNNVTLEDCIKTKTIKTPLEVLDRFRINIHEAYHEMLGVTTSRDFSLSYTKKSNERHITAKVARPCVCNIPKIEIDDTYIIKTPFIAYKTKMSSVTPDNE